MSDTDWYLLDRGGRRYGPYDRELIDQLAAQRELQPATPVWYPGLARWQRADRVLTLPRTEHAPPSAGPMQRPSVSAPRPPSSSQSAQPRATPDRVAPARAMSARPVKTAPPAARSAARVTPATAQSARPAPRASSAAKAAAPAVKFTSTPMTPPQAARRVVATLFDLLCVYAVFRLFGIALPANDLQSLGRSVPLFFVVWAALDAAFTVRASATPGRALVGIRIRSAQDEALPWPRAMIRSGALPLLLMLLTLRTGFTIFIAVAVLILTARRLRAGFAPWWDDAAGARVSYGEMTPSRTALTVIAFLVALFIVLVAIP